MLSGKAYGESYGHQPDSGNPTVRDENGGLRKHGLLINVDKFGFTGVLNKTQPLIVRIGTINRAKNKPFQPVDDDCVRRTSIQTACLVMLSLIRET